MAKNVTVRFVGDAGQLLGTLRAVGAETAATAARAETMGDKIGRVGQTMSRVGAGTTRALTLPLVAVGLGAAKLSAEFETSMSRIQGLVGASESQVGTWSEEIIGMSKELPQAPKELADALYFVTSSGIPAADAMEVVKVSAKAAAAGLGETQMVADAVTSAMNAYGHGNLSAAEATDILVGAVKEGKGAPEDLAQAIGRVIAPAESLGISFDEVGAAMASMTLAGLDANEAATALSGIMTALRRPSGEANKALADMGLSAEGLRKIISEQGLLAGMMLLRDRTEGNTEAMSALFPEVRGLNGFMIMTGENAGKTADIFSNLSNATGLTDKAFAAASDTAAFKMNKSLAEMKGAGIELGAALLPALTSIADGVATLAGGFSDLPSGFQSAALTAGLALAAIGPIVTVAGKAALAVKGLATAVTFLAASQNLLALSSVGVGLALAGVAAGAWMVTQTVAAMKKADKEMVDGQAVATNNAALLSGAHKLTATATKEAAVAAYMNASSLNKQEDAQKGAAHYGKEFAAVQARARTTLEALSASTGVSKERIVELANEMGINLGGKSEEARQKLAEAVAGIAKAVTPTQRLAVVTEDLGSETATTKEKFDALREAVDAAFGVFLDADDAALSLEGRIRGVGDTYSEIADAQRQANEIPQDRDADIAEVNAAHAKAIADADADRRKALAEGDTAGVARADERLGELRTTGAADAAAQIAEIRKRADADLVAAKKRIDDLTFSLRQAPIDLARAAQAEADALVRSGQLAVGSAAYKQFLIDKLKALQVEFPALAGQIQGYIDKVLLIPQEATTTVTADTAGAMSAIDLLRANILSLAPLITADTGNILSGFPRAETTAVTAGVTAPAATATAQSGAGSTVTINQTINANEMPTEAALEEANRANGWRLAVTPR